MNDKILSVMNRKSHIYYALTGVAYTPHSHESSISNMDWVSQLIDVCISSTRVSIWITNKHILYHILALIIHNYFSDLVSVGDDRAIPINFFSYND